MCSTMIMISGDAHTYILYMKCFSHSFHRELLRFFLLAMQIQIESGIFVFQCVYVLFRVWLYCITAARVLCAYGILVFYCYQFAPKWIEWCDLLTWQTRSFELAIYIYVLIHLWLLRFLCIRYFIKCVTVLWFVWDKNTGNVHMYILLSAHILGFKWMTWNM